MPEIIIPYRPRSAFKTYHETDKRFNVRVVHRRAGKTTATINNKIRRALEDPVEQLAQRGILPASSSEAAAWRGMPRMYPIIFPQLKQAKSIGWGPLKYFTDRIPGRKFNEQETSVTFANNSVIRLFGSGPSESDGFRGQKLWDVDFDEYQDCDPNVWYEIVRPACIDTLAPVGFSGTIKGKNHLYRLYQEHKDDPEWFSMWLRASESGIIPAEILRKEREQYEREGKLNKFLQEFELEPMAIIEGAIFGKEFAWLREKGRITSIQPESLLAVDTFWDLGWADFLVVLFIQRYGMQSRVIDAIVTQGTSLIEIAKQMKEKKYSYGTHYIPHDAAQHDLGIGVSRSDQLKTLLRGYGDVELVKRVKSKDDAISSVRAMYQRLWIHSGLELVIDGFAQYEWEFNEELKVFMPAPKHNWCSHIADAFMGWAKIEMEATLEVALPPRIRESNRDSHFTDDGGFQV